jgi:hypothetical protein
VPSWIKIVNPTAQDVIVEYGLAARLSSLRGARIGIIDNSKHMAAEFLEALEGELRKHYGVEITGRYEKLNAAIPSPPAVIQRFVESCDAIVHGVGD